MTDLVPNVILLWDRVVDLRSRTVQRADDRDSLSAREVALLRVLLENPGQVFDRQALLESVWGHSVATQTRTVDHAVRRLRKKIEADPSSPAHLVTVHGEGYAFEPVRAAQPLPAPGPRPRLHLGACEVDLALGAVFRDRREISLTPREQAVLQALHVQQGAFVERATLLHDIWGLRADNRTKALTVTVARLRQKIEADPERPKALISKRGRGYALLVPSKVQRGGVEIVGRDDVLDRLRSALDTSPLVTLFGPGGIGKTRLARQIASERSDSLWVELEGVRTPADVVGRVAQALGLRIGVRGVEAQADRVGRVLEQRGDLLILDNFEDAEDAAHLPETWSRSVSVLLTSRVRLGGSRERLIEVGPLEPGDGGRLVQTLCERRGIRLDADADVAGLADDLDGSPLAIELATGRLGLLSVSALRERLDRRFALLRRSEGGRHGSLWRVVGDSWDALSVGARSTLSRCALFARPFTFDLAEELIDDVALVDHLQELLDRSMVQSDRAASPSLRMSATVRAFALERLDDPGAVLRHGQVTLSRAEALTGRLEEEDVAPGRSLAALVPDLRAAFTRVRGIDAELAVRIGLAADAWISRLGPTGPDESLLTALRDCASGVGEPLRAQAWLSHASRLARLGRPSDAIKLIGEARAWRTDNAFQARACAALAEDQLSIGDVDAALATAEEGLELLGATGPGRTRSLLFLSLGRCAWFRGDREGAHAHLRSSVAAADRPETAMVRRGVLSVLAQLLGERGDGAAALALYQDNIRVFRRRDSNALAHALCSQGLLLLDAGDAEGAQRSIREARDLHRRLGQPDWQSRDETALGDVFLTIGDLEAAVEAYTSARALARSGSWQDWAASAGLALVDALRGLDLGRSAAALAATDPGAGSGQRRVVAAAERHDHVALEGLTEAGESRVRILARAALRRIPRQHVPLA